MNSKISGKAPPRTQSAAPTIVDLRRAIGQALEDGSEIETLRLRVTRRHEAEIKRSPDVRLDEVAFKDGVMTFLGVKVLAGMNDVSFLDLNGAETEAADIAAAAEAAAKPVKKKAPAKPRMTKAAKEAAAKEAAEAAA